MRKREILKLFNEEFDYSALMRSVRILSEAYDFLQFSYLTESTMGKGIPLLSLGEGEKEIYYIGAHHGAERITAALLVNFISELCCYIKNNSVVYGISTEYLLKSRRLCIIPMLNPDGVDISLGKIEKDSPFYERLLKMNQSEDFSLWQANARGVDLNHNYDAGFEEYKELEREMHIFGGASTRFSGEYPESEVESGGLCNYLRFNNPTALITLHTQGREIYSGDMTQTKAAAMVLSRLTGYRCMVPSGAAGYGGLTDFCLKKLSLPAFTLECGKGKNPLPTSDFYSIYTEIRQALFTFPIMY